MKKRLHNPKGHKYASAKNRENNSRKKGFLGIPFAWLFALIVGGMILFLAIFAVTRISDTQQIALDAQTSKQIGVLLNPLEIGFETAKTTSMALPSETRIYNRCDAKEDEADDYFGRQIIRVAQKTFNKWSDTNVDVGFSNKYIFSEDFVEGKKFYLFSKPFNLPFKVADVIYLTSFDKNYCFRGAPDEVVEEIGNLNLNNLFFEDCPAGSIEVCFGGNCDIEVDLTASNPYVKKGDNQMYFGGDNSLMYAAIFSDPQVYECQLKRLMKRGRQLSQLYIEKANLVAREECFSNTNLQLSQLGSAENGFISSVGLNFVSGIADSAESANGVASCKLW